MRHISLLELNSYSKTKNQITQNNISFEKHYLAWLGLAFEREKAALHAIFNYAVDNATNCAKSDYTGNSNKSAKAIASQIYMMDLEFVFFV